MVQADSKYIELKLFCFGCAEVPHLAEMYKDSCYFLRRRDFLDIFTGFDNQ